MVWLSSKWTLFFKLFIPVLWASFFGALTIAIQFIEEPLFETMTNATFRIVAAISFLIVALVIYLSIFQLKKVDADETHIYVSNYFKTFKYPLTDISKITELDLGLFPLLKVSFKAKTYFGKSFRFLADTKRLQLYLDNYPKVTASFYKK